MDASADPLALAAGLHRRGEDFALLYSSLKTSYSGERTLLAHGVAERVTGDDISLLPTHSSDAGTWYGWLGYGLRHKLEVLGADPPSFIELSPLCMTRFAQEQEFAFAPVLSSASHDNRNVVAALASNMTRAEYLRKVAATIECIREGKFYQANITRKFYGELMAGVLPDEIFSRLVAGSPAPYSAWLRAGDVHVLSSSPELFLRISPQGDMLTRPIKGSAPVQEPVELLRNSVKDKAENLMIADLMRNDFSRVAAPGSVRVSELFGVDSFATIHHMSSSIEAQLAKEHSVLDAIKACFPPGSMTGAPKIAAMRWCSHMEAVERGVYSGAIGWIAPDSCELSVVIRTLVIQGNRFEFQVGGGIVADSDPEAEWQETMTKARGIAAALGIGIDTLYAL